VALACRPAQIVPGPSRLTPPAIFLNGVFAAGSAGGAYPVPDSVWKAARAGD
jgi:hypothetical protein